MQHSPGEANKSWVTQKIPETSCSLPCSQQHTICSYSMHPLHAFPATSLKSIFILSFYLVFQVVSFLQFPHQNPACISLCLHACHMPHPPHPHLIDHPNIWGWVEFMKLCNFLQPLVPSYLLGPSMFLSTLFLNTLSPCHTLNVKDWV